MKILHLPLKKEWYEMIERGEKLEEYREVCDYWIKRLCDNPIFDSNRNIIGRCEINNWTIKECERRGLDLVEQLRRGNMIAKDFANVCFSYGYTKRRMTFECKGITIGRGRPEWGAPDYNTFIIKLGNRIQ